MSSGAPAWLVPDPPARAVEPALFRRVMGRLPTGVTVVTTVVGDKRHGMTANAVTSVSLEPVLLLVCLVRGSRTARAVAESGAFSVNILRDDQEEISRRFASPGADHFDGVAIDIGHDRLPRIAGCLGYLSCRVVELLGGGDHDIVLGRVEHCEASDGNPLVFFGGAYERLSRPLR